MAIPINPDNVSVLHFVSVAVGNGDPLGVAEQGGGLLSVSGSFVATIVFEGSLDGTNWFSIEGINLSNDVRATSTTVPGIFIILAPGMNFIRARISSYTSGEVSVKGTQFSVEASSVLPSGVVIHALTHEQGASDPIVSLPVPGEKSALAGTSGIPGAANKYVTDTDTRNTNARTPVAHKDTHKSLGSDAFLSTDLIEAVIKRIREAGGADLLLGAVADGQFLKRSAASLIGATANIGGYAVNNLVGQNDAVTPNTKFGYTVDLVVMRNPSTGTILVGENFGTVTNDISVAGPAANGRDQAGAFAANTWIHFYFIASTTNAVASLSSTTAPPIGPTLPTGYTHWAYVGAIRFNAASQLLKARMSGSWVLYEGFQEVLQAGSAQTETAVSLATFVPPNALRVEMWYANNAAVSMHIRYVPGINFIESASLERSSFIIPNRSQQVFYIYDAAGGQLYLEIVGYVVPNGGE